MRCTAVAILLGCVFVEGKIPFTPPRNAFPFIAYYASYYRGICVASFVSRVALLSAAICVSDPYTYTVDQRPLVVVTGAYYREDNRGYRTPVSYILIPKWNGTASSAYFLLARAPAILLLRSKVPDALVEHPVRPVLTSLDPEFEGDHMAPGEDCVAVGWHFFAPRVDKVYPPRKFRLPRNLRAQYLTYSDPGHPDCLYLLDKTQRSLDTMNLPNAGSLNTSYYCMRNIEKQAQPCQGMYGAPLICDGRIVALLTSPDSQSGLCNRFANFFFKLNLPPSTDYLESLYNDFLLCVAGMFEAEMVVDMNALMEYFEGAEFGPRSDYSQLEENYELVVPPSDSSSGEGPGQ